jgi:PAS domain S-box-containing protein
MDYGPSDDRYRVLLSSIDEAFCVIEVLFDGDRRAVDYRFLEVNPEFERQTGLVDATGKWMRELAPSHESHWFEIYGRVALTGEPVRFENDARALGGRRFDVNAFRLGEPELRQVGVLFSDVTKRRQDEEQLRRNHDTFYHLIQNNPFGVYVVDADFKLRQVSLGAQKVFSTVRPLLGRDFAEVLRAIWVEPFATEAIDRFRKTLDTGEPYRAATVRERRRDIGEIEDYDWRIERVTLPDGRYGVVCYFYDLSERLRWEAALRESEEQLRLAISIAQMGTFQIDLKTDAVEVNEPGRAIYGWAIDEPLTFAKVQSQFHPEDGPQVMERVAAAFEPSGPGEFEVEQRIIRNDGATRWIRVRGRTSFEGAGDDRAAIRCLGTFLDITDQRDLQARIERLLEAEQAARAEAERASEAKSDFLAALSHELRTPLTPVLLTASLMESHPELPDDLRADVAMIRRNVELESRLISDLLDLTRITKGKLQLDEQDMDVHLVVRSAVDICQREASTKLTLELLAPRHRVRGDTVRLQQVFWNLINNAIKFTGSTGTITVRSSNTAEDRLLVEVIDTGAGIDPSVLPKLFTAFEQGEVRTVRQQAGLGLGLAISKRLTEAHGGQITAFSEGRGRGATFAVELPTVESIASHQVASPGPITPPTGRGLSVLLVEDHDATLDVMTRLLRSLKHRVTGAVSIESALAAAKADGFDLIISDLGLPDGSGLELMRQLSDRYAGRAIALTGYGMESDLAASREAGFAAHLTKPVDLAALVAAIGRVAG